MANMEFKFNEAIVNIKNKNIYINIKDEDKHKKFIDEFLSSLREKYKGYSFRINKISNVIITEKEKINVYRNKNLKVNQKVKTIGRITEVDIVQKLDKFYYDITLENITEATALKLFGIFNKKIDFLIPNNYIVFSGIVKEIEKKQYEKNMDFNKFIIKILEVSQISKKEIKNIIENTGSTRRPLCVSSVWGNGFIDNKKISKRDETISNYCITDLNTLNFVANENKDMPIGVKGYVQIDNKFYSVHIYIYSQDTEIDFNNKKIKINEGIRKLNEMLSNGETYNGGTVFKIKDLLENKDKFKIGSMDNEGIIYQALLDNDFNMVEKYIELFDILAIEPISNLVHLCSEGRKNSSYSNLKKVNELIRRLALKYCLPFVFNDNPIVLDKEDREIALEFIISNKIKEENVKNKEQFIEEQKQKIKLSDIGYIRDVPEMTEELYEQGFDLDDIEHILFDELLFHANLPKKSEITIIPECLFVDDNKSEKEKLMEMLKNTIKNIKLDNKEAVIKRANEELKLILKNNYQRVFLAAATIAKRSKDLGYPIGDRGTAGCMLLCYLLGISSTNPINYNLNYKMFLGPNSEKVPDIDINVSADIVKEISDEFKKYFPKTMKASIASYFKENSIKSQIFSKTNPKDLDIYYACSMLSGKIARIQPHNSGIMLLPDFDINYIFPTIKYNNEEIPGYPYEFLERNIPKIDILSKNDMNILKDIEREIKLKDINLEIPEIYSLINRDTSEISELNTEYARKIIELIKPKNFKDLIIIQGLLHGKGILTSAERCRKDKLPIISSREDLLYILKKYNLNNSFDIMEKIRKGNFNKLTEEELKDINKLPEEYKKAVEQIQYLFPRSHAISYAKQAYYNAYYILNKDRILKSKLNKTDDEELSIEDIEEFLEEE